MKKRVPHEKQILNCLLEFIKEHGYEPDIVTIQKSIGVSRSTIYEYFKKYQNEGLLKKLEVPRNSHYLCNAEKIEKRISEIPDMIPVDIAKIDESHKKALRRVLAGMKSRCNNPNSTAYHYYGGRGISLCDEWLDSCVFIEWANENGYKTNLTIDRINNDGNYEPSNCRWVTRKVQSQNRRNVITYKGETAFDASKRLGGCPRTVYHRIIKSGWSKKDAFTKPINSND